MIKRFIANFDLYTKLIKKKSQSRSYLQFINQQNSILYFKTAENFNKKI